MKSGNLNFLEPSGPLKACNGTALRFTFTVYISTKHFLSQYTVVCTVTYKLNLRVLEIAQNDNGRVAHHKSDMQTYVVCSIESVLLPLFTLVPSLAVFHYFP